MFEPSMYIKNLQKGLKSKGSLPHGRFDQYKAGDSNDIHLDLVVPVSFTLLGEVSWPPWKSHQHNYYVPCKCDCMKEC